MKEVIYKDGIRRKPKLLALAEQATETLEDILGHNAPDISAEWDSTRNARGEDVLTLRLADWAGSATGVFEPEEWEHSNLLKSGLRLLWDDVLRIRNHKQLQDLLRSDQG
jgi:hypothetical protein